MSAKATSPDCTDPTKTDAPFTINYSSSNATVVKLANGSTIVAQEAPPPPSRGSSTTARPRLPATPSPRRGPAATPRR
ncbi:hypothetical protein GCM10025881_33260 [Pseudolysinimonas kribbensis]|uniref:Uncharacterized protein n=1 Tax=Pseudolysinimonas kribbensis TaxID=433641 RepID=A0ABQ6K932_9MICO|nr:hypothetical protein GCM10025881_33260 [Pseudolysinimonas kribbensis]